ncbi:MAG: type II secretion system protein GspG [Planctomycetota bacterium]|jgi:general secretion pathway protein G
MRAFTLLELMIVIALIGLIAALTTPRIIRSYREGQRRLAYAKCQAYYDATWEWMMFTRAPEPPESLEALEQPLRPGERSFMRHAEDPWGTKYRIEREGGRLYRIWSNGPDGQPNTDDDIAYEPVDE